MAQGPEAKVKIWLRNKLTKALPDAWIYMAPGGRFGRIGVPDILMCYSGLFISIEVKADKSKSPTAMQERELDLIEKAGGIACVIKGKDDVVLSLLIEEIMNRARSIQKEIYLSQQCGGSQSNLR